MKKSSSQEPLGQFGTKHHWVKETQESFNYQKEMIAFLLSNSNFYIIALSKCVNWFELVSQVIGVGHGPLPNQYAIHSNFLYIGRYLWLEIVAHARMHCKMVFNFTVHHDQKPSNKKTAHWSKKLEPYNIGQLRKWWKQINACFHTLAAANNLNTECYVIQSKECKQK